MVQVDKNYGKEIKLYANVQWNEDYLPKIDLEGKKIFCCCYDKSLKTQDGKF